MSSDLTIAEVDAAIRRCLLAQNYETPDGSSKTSALLKDLRELRRELINESAEAGNNSGAMSTVAQVEFPSG
jgi:hypothetical protein